MTCHLGNAGQQNAARGFFREQHFRLLAAAQIFLHPLVLVRHVITTQFAAGRGISKMFDHNLIPATKVMLLAGVLASGISVSPARAQSTDPAPAKPAPAAGAAARSLSNRVPMREQMYYQAVWGVDSFKVKYTESGEIVRFSYRVVDPEKATALNDKKAEPTLIDPQAGVSLVVPQVTNIGKLRQSSTPKAGMTYWMAFSNVGRRVKRGDRVDIVIGHFRATGVVVE